MPFGDRLSLPTFRDRGGAEASTSSESSTAASSGGAETSRLDEGIIGLYPYSGADIKLICHLPPENPQADSQELTDALAEQETVAAALEEASSTSAITQLDTELASINAALEPLHERIAELALGAASVPGESTYEEYLEEVDLYNTRGAEITSQLAAARREGSREELEERARIIGAQIAELREDVPSGGATRTKVLGEIQTMSYSVHREKYPVRTLGSTYVRSVTRGPRTISGSVVFATFNKHVMSEFLEATEYRSTGVGDWDRFRWTSYLMDQLPPLDISASFANEYGNLSWTSFLGVEFVNEGGVMSIEDLYLENTAQYIARDWDPMRNVANRTISRNRGVGQALSGTNVMLDNIRQRQNLRNTPWI